MTRLNHLSYHNHEQSQYMFGPSVEDHLVPLFNMLSTFCSNVIPMLNWNSGIDDTCKNIFPGFNFIIWHEEKK